MHSGVYELQGFPLENQEQKKKQTLRGSFRYRIFKHIRKNCGSCPNSLLKTLGAFNITIIAPNAYKFEMKMNFFFFSVF